MAVVRASRSKAEPTSPKTKESQTSIALKANPRTLDKAAGRVVAKAVEDGLEEEDGGIIVVEDRAVAAGAVVGISRKQEKSSKRRRESPFAFCVEPAALGRGLFSNG